MIKDENWILLGRYLADTCSEEDKKTVESWIAGNPDNKKFVELMATAKQSQQDLHQSSDVQKLWNEVAAKAGIASEVEEAKKSSQNIIQWSHLYRPKVFQILRYAAVLLILIMLPYVIYNTFSNSPLFQSTHELMTLTVKKGDRQEVNLNDGSRVVLDAGSQFSYPETFDSNNREVFLNGEGFFEVQGNPEKPFIVHAGDAVVEVLGTKFNVRAWKKYKKTQVVVAEGKVSLNSEKGSIQDAVILLAGLSSTLSADGLPSKPQKINPDNYLSWMHNEVVFNDTPLEEILFQLERWYDLQFVLSDSAIAQERLTVHIQSTSVKDILELIAALTDLRYTYSGKRVRFTSKEFN